MIIYKATNLVNSKIYIGQTVNSLKYRQEQHWREANCKVRKNVHFHNALLKYGLDNFSFEIIDEASTVQEMNEKEQFWIAYYHSTNSSYGYNKDSGGKSGGFKSKDTKMKIGITTKEKWSKPESAQKMREGLAKGTESWRRICQSRRVQFICPYCGKEEWLPAWQARSKRACSKTCLQQHGGFVDNALKASQIASQKVHQCNIERKEQIARDISDWCQHNQEVIRNCPYNAITSGLKPLLDYVLDKYGLKDLRSLFICFHVSNKKELLSYLKTIVA